MEKALVGLLLTCLLDFSFSFHFFVPVSFSQSNRRDDLEYTPLAQRLTQPLCLSSNDDDWYSDFKPKAYSNQETRFPSTFNRNDRGGSGRGGDRRSGGRGRGRGGGGPTKYVRDTSMDESRVDVDAVERLLDQRTAARRRNDFDEADQIRATLLNEYGVQVWDKENIWRTGASPSGSGMRRREDSPQRGRGRGNRPPRPPKEFGPTGHDYQLSPDAGPLAADISESEIHSLIAARLRAKMSRNFEQADQIQIELTEAGVYIHDGRKEWRADGTMFGDYASSGDRPGRERGSRRDRDSAPYEQSPYSSGIDILTEEEIADINSMVSRRAGAKLSRNYKTADRIRDELKAEYNVFLEDRLRQWSVGGDFGPDSPSNQDPSRFQPWRMSSFSDPVIDEAQESAVLMQLEERDAAKATRDFDSADDIRDSLLSDFDVAIDDRLREWSIGGNFGLKTSPKKRDSYARRGGGELTADQEAEVLDIVEQRAIAKKNRNFDAADELRDILDEQFSVKVDDKTKEWWVKSDTYAMSRSDNRLAKSLDADTMEYINQRLKERWELKNVKDFDAADAIRDELRGQYGVTIDDRVMEWFIEVDQYTVVERGFEDKQSSISQAASNSHEENDDLEEEFDDVNETGTFNDGLDLSNADDADLENLTVPELKERLRALGLPVSGRKSELIERLTESSSSLS